MNRLYENKLSGEDLTSPQIKTILSFRWGCLILFLLGLGGVSLGALNSSRIFNSKIGLESLHPRGGMWNGGKSTLPVHFELFNGSLKVEVAGSCKDFEVRLRLAGGTQFKSSALQENSVYHKNCQNNSILLLPLSVNPPSQGTGYIIVDVMIRDNQGVASMTKAFAVSQKDNMEIPTRPTSIDQDGVQYHEFKSTVFKK